ncbi:MAG: sulfatase, partial [Bacteroidota bacterium]
MRFLIVSFCLILVGCGSTSEPLVDRPKQKPNVLFIAIDDLRPELGCYGSPIAITPNLDKLASQGLRFNRAYCQQAICSPSRASIMTGARPESTGIIENYTYFRDVLPDIITLPQHFRNHGYETVYTGKIYHGKFTDEEKSWSRQPAKPAVKKPNYPGGYALKENQEAYLKNKAAMKAKYGDVYGLGMGPAYENADVPDYHYTDGYNAERALATLKDLVDNGGDKPFFFGYGFHHPHLNWTSPKKYWDLYDPADIPLAELTEAPEGGAAMGLHASFELRVRDGVPDGGPISTEEARMLKHAYLAAVSYVDAQIGKMISALEDAGLRDNTIIIVWSDHGWHLGDMGVWGKATNYEIATRVPLLIWTPDMPAGTRGKSSDALVELVDMYPTLSELAGLPRLDHLEGQSFVPLLEDPGKSWKTAAFSQYPNPALREWAANPLNQGMRETYFGPLIEEVEDRIKKQMGEAWDRGLFEEHLMGYSMRTDRYRLVVWKDRRRPAA